MTCPVSMDDEDLFPKSRILDLNFSVKSEINAEIFKQMFSSLDRLWWSRLVISVRGYVLNYVQKDIEVVFSCEDAFIRIHTIFAEKHSQFDKGYVYLNSMLHLIREKNQLIQLISSSHDSRAPSISPELKSSFELILPHFSDIYLKLAIAQFPALIMFLKVFIILQQRWINEKSKKKSIRFETDPEWEPDERVVLFQTFGHDNRTWVLHDFDRYVLQQWKPNGTSVIFGDRFIEKKKRAGLKLCTVCGMIEQTIGQFRTFRDECFCSKQCYLEAFPQ